MDHLEARSDAVRLMCRYVSDVAASKLWAVEQSAYETYRTLSGYRRCIARMCHNLKKNPELVFKYSPHMLVTLDHTVLAIGTDVEAWTRSMQDAILQSQQLLNAHQLEQSFLNCKRCKSSSISFKQQQTRSADEAMTVFCTCTTCGLRWKM
jgi:transcription elongation factor S-II